MLAFIIKEFILGNACISYNGLQEKDFVNFLSAAVIPEHNTAVCTNVCIWVYRDFEPKPNQWELSWKSCLILPVLQSASLGPGEPIGPENRSELYCSLKHTAQTQWGWVKLHIGGQGRLVVCCCPSSPVIWAPLLFWDNPKQWIVFFLGGGYPPKRG